jgi:acyl-CoA reductase-like NAD-dependent aldehyde dehydrogenase
MCGEKLIPLSAELGGNDAALVLADCDLDRTLAGVTHWALHNAGQNCGAIERLYVEDRVADTFVERLTRAWRRLGDMSDLGRTLCPLANEGQLQVVQRHVEDAVAQGARLLCGGAPLGDGLGYPPTLLDGCTRDMAVMQEETFGPVLAVARVRDADEGVQQANDSRYGLGGSIWTRDLARGRELAERLECGVVNVNNHAVTGAMVNVPWCGTKDTGTGVANSEHALSTFLRPRTLLVDKSRKPDLFWMPFDNTLRQLGERLAALQLGALGGALKLPTLVSRRIKTIRAFFGSRHRGPESETPA